VRGALPDGDRSARSQPLALARVGTGLSDGALHVLARVGGALPDGARPTLVRASPSWDPDGIGGPQAAKRHPAPPDQDPRQDVTKRRPPKRPAPPVAPRHPVRSPTPNRRGG